MHQSALRIAKHIVVKRPSQRKLMIGVITPNLYKQLAAPHQNIWDKDALN